MSDAKDGYELLLDPKEERLVPLPVKYSDINAFYELLEATSWSEGHFLDSIEQDREQFNSLDPKVQKLVKGVLAFFAASDGIVNANLGTRFISEVKVTEAQMFYIAQARMEVIHARTYARLIEACIADEEERQNTYDALKLIPAIKAKGEWAKKWIDSDKSFAHRLLAFACVEGIYFCGSFCVVFWIMTKNILPGLTTSNEWIARDESLHTAFAVWLYVHYIRNKLTEEEVYELITEAVDIEEGFIKYLLPEDLLGMNGVLMKQYIQFVADGLLKDLGYKPYYNVKQPFEFMKKQNVSDTRSNFFEVVVTTYNQYGMGVDMSKFNMDKICNKFSLKDTEAYKISVKE